MIHRGNKNEHLSQMRRGSCLDTRVSQFNELSQFCRVPHPIALLSRILLFQWHKPERTLASAKKSLFHMFGVVGGGGAGPVIQAALNIYEQRGPKRREAECTDL